MRYIFTVLFLFFSSIFFTLKAQEYSVSWSPKLSDRKVRLLTVEQEAYFCMFPANSALKIVKYNLDHERAWERKFDHSSFAKKMTYSDFFETKRGKFGLFYSCPYLSKTFSIYFSKFEEYGFEECNHLYVHEHDNIKGAFDDRESTDAQLSVKVSKNKERVLITNDTKSYDGINNEKRAIAVFDEDLNLLWEKTYDFGLKDYDILVMQSDVSNDGEVFILAAVYDKKTRKRKGWIPKFDYVVYKFTENETKEARLNLGDNIGASSGKLFLPEKQKGDFVLLGFYNDKDKKGEKGTFFAKGNDLGFTDVKIKEVSKEVYLNEGGKQKMDFYRFTLNALVYNDKGELGMIMEKIDNTNTGGILSGQIIMWRFSEDGDITNIYFFDKKYKTSQFKTTLGFTFFTTYEDKVYFLYNDEKSKEQKQFVSKDSHMDGVCTNLLVFNFNTSEVEYNEVLFTDKEVGLDVVPLRSVNEDGLLFIRGGSFSGDSFGLIDLRGDNED